MFTSITALVLWSIVRGRGKHELHYLAAIAYVAATVVLGWISAVVLWFLVESRGYRMSPTESGAFMAVAIALMLFGLLQWRVNLESTRAAIASIATVAAFFGALALTSAVRVAMDSQ